LEAGMDDYISKPFSFDDIYAAINRVLYKDEQSSDDMQKEKEDEKGSLDPDEKVNETLSESGTVNETGPIIV